MAEPRRLTAAPRLFVDFRDVERRENICHQYHQARKYGTHPVLRQEAAWEKHPGMTASVIYDEQERLFKAWYMAGFYAPGAAHVQCLALSEDGIHWWRPALRLHEALGSKENNLVIPAAYHEGQDHFETVLKDVGDPDAARRYKAIGWSSYDWEGPLSGIYTATSPDGLTWRHTPEPVFRFHPRPGTADLGPVGDAQAMMVDTLKGRYAAFLRGGASRLLSWSEDFVHWTPPKPFLTALHDEEGLYNNTGFVYGDQYLGILTHFDKGPLAQSQTLRLLSSRDGESWARIPGEPLVGLGEIGGWDRFQLLLTGAPPIRVGDQLFIYYRGTARRHNKVPAEYDPRIIPDQDPRSMAIGLATLRVDGFASVSASYDGGVLTTRLLRAGGEELRLNLKADYGQVFVECLDEEDRVIPGFGREDCVPLQMDAVAAPVRWQGKPGLGPLREGPFKLRFHLHNARLYSYCCV
ncbi:MAG: hypothetical protein IT369_13195 [Candidatus Latescibacteria bacterium]|nr:hypothetical protein [Candidatus Latescibacterota bacterium]